MDEKQDRILELCNQVNEFVGQVDELNDNIDTLNKGIDELITEYYKLKIVNDELLEEATENNNNVKMQIYTQCIRYIKHTIDSLKKLKGE